MKAVRQALLRWYVAGVPDVDLVPVEDLPDGLRALHADAVRAAGAPVHLLDVTTDLDVPVYLAVSPAAGGEPTRLGAGASIWAAKDSPTVMARRWSSWIPPCAMLPTWPSSCPSPTLTRR